MRSCSTDKFLAAADAILIGMYIKTVLNNVNICHDLQLTVDSIALASLSASIKEPQECLKKIDLAAIREVFVEGELSAVHWCPGQKLLADALIMDNNLTAKLLHTALVTISHTRPEETPTNLGLRTFKPI